MCHHSRNYPSPVLSGDVPLWNVDTDRMLFHHLQKGELNIMKPGSVD